MDPPRRPERSLRRGRAGDRGLSHARRPLRAPPRVRLRSALPRARRASNALRGRGEERRPSDPVPPRRADLELPVPNDHRRPVGSRPTGRTRPVRLRPVGQAHRPRVLHVRPPRRLDHVVRRTAGPQRADARRARLGRADRPAVRRRASRTGGPADRAEHVRLRRLGPVADAGVPAVARLRRARRARAPGGVRSPGRHPDRAPARGSGGVRRALPHTGVEDRRGDVPTARPGGRRRPRSRGAAPGPREPRRVGQAGLGVLRRRGPGVHRRYRRGRWRRSIPTSGEPEIVAGAAHFLQEDRGGALTRRIRRFLAETR